MKNNGTVLYETSVFSSVFHFVRQSRHSNITAGKPETMVSIFHLFVVDFCLSVILKSLSISGGNLVLGFYYAFVHIAHSMNVGALPQKHYCN